MYDAFGCYIPTRSNRYPSPRRRLTPGAFSWAAWGCLLGCLLVGYAWCQVGERPPLDNRRQLASSPTGTAAGSLTWPAPMGDSPPGHLPGEVWSLPGRPTAAPGGGHHRDAPGCTPGRAGGRTAHGGGYAARGMGRADLSRMEPACDAFRPGQARPVSNRWRLRRMDRGG